jgi:hypothetical protein
MEGMPEEIQLLPSDKKRESEENILELLLDTLLLFATTRFGRDYMRQKQVYVVIKHLHRATDKEPIIERCESFVNLVMRDEEIDDKKNSDDEIQVI